MKRIETGLIVWALLAGISAANAAEVSTPIFRLQDGTPVKLRLQETLSSADAQVDERVDFDVVEEVDVNGAVVIPKGSVALATVTAAESKKRLGRGGKLDVNIDFVRLADDEKAALRSAKTVKGGGHTGMMVGGMVGTALVFWPAAPLWLLKHGKDVTIPKGTEITAYVAGDMNLEAAKFAPSHDQDPGPAPAVAPGANNSTDAHSWSDSLWAR